MPLPLHAGMDISTTDLANAADAEIAAARAKLFVALEKDIADFIRARQPYAVSVDIFDKTTAARGDVRHAAIHTTVSDATVYYKWEHGVDDALWTLQRIVIRLRSHGWQQPQPGDYHSPYRINFADADAAFNEHAR